MNNILKHMLFIILPSFILSFIFSNMLLFIAMNKHELSNTRSALITKYNEVATLWNSVGYPKFKEASFHLSIDEKPYELQHLIDEHGYNWPVRDSCEIENDPKEGCVSAKSDIILNKSIVLKNNSQIVLKGPHDEQLFNITMSAMDYEIVTRDDLQCTTDDVCIDLCHQLRGTWDNNQCSLTLYLSSMCFRVHEEDDNHYSIDYPSSLLRLYYRVYHRSNVGCYYNGGTWSPFIYTVTPPTSISFSIRHEYDPYSAASGLTKGCSEQPYEQNCFNVPKSVPISESQTIYYFGLFALFVSFMSLISSIIQYIEEKHSKDDEDQRESLLNKSNNFLNV
ncbi:hypothetical protein WA158_000157 [Blastocystis sp. Blastoise]